MIQNGISQPGFEKKYFNLEYFAHKNFLFTKEQKAKKLIIIMAIIINN